MINTYKTIYKNIIDKENELLEKTKQMIEADKCIHTTYVDEPKEYNEEIKRRFKRQRNTIERFESERKNTRTK